MNRPPFVTVIMPVRNEARFIASSIQAVLAQDYPRDRIEILVIDGMSTDGTREVINSLAENHSNLRIINNPGLIVPTGMNIALQQSKGEIIVRIDGHCEPAPDYVSRAVDHLLTENIDGVGGPIETIGETTVAKAIALAMSSSFGVGGSAFRTVKDRSMLTDTVAFPAYTREIVERVGPYDEELVRNQDDEYNYRLRKLGGKLLLAEDIKSLYYSRSSLASTWRQYFRYGYWKVRVMQKHPAQMRPRQFIPPLFVLSLLLTFIAAPFLWLGFWMWIGLVGTYLTANVLCSIVLSARNRFWLGPLLLPAVFVVLHVGYGSGFLYGLIVFRNRWKGTQEYANLELPGEERV